MEESCLSCRLENSALKTTFLEGKNGVLVVGESPKADLDFMFSNIHKYPALKRLREELAIVDICLEDCSFAEIIRCELNDRKYFKEVAVKCLSFLFETIIELKPRVIITFGLLPMQILSEYFGQEYRVGEIAEINGIMYLPLFHPSPANPTGHSKNIEILKSLDRGVLMS